MSFPDLNTEFAAKHHVMDEMLHNIPLDIAHRKLLEEHLWVLVSTSPVVYAEYWEGTHTFYEGGYPTPRPCFYFQLVTENSFIFGYMETPEPGSEQNIQPQFEAQPFNVTSVQFKGAANDQKESTTPAGVGTLEIQRNRHVGGYTRYDYRSQTVSLGSHSYGNVQVRTYGELRQAAAAIQGNWNR